VKKIKASFPAQKDGQAPSCVYHTSGSRDMCVFVFLTSFCCLHLLSRFDKHTIFRFSCPVCELQRFTRAQCGLGFAGCCHVGVCFSSFWLRANVLVTSLLAQTPVRKSVSLINAEVLATTYVSIIGARLLFG
jgi:hypothetical protein